MMSVSLVAKRALDQTLSLVFPENGELVCGPRLSFMIHNERL